MAESKHARRLVETSLVFLAFLLPGYLTVPSDRASLRVSLLVAPTLIAAVPQLGLVLYLFLIQGEIGRPELGLKAPRAGEIPVALLTALLMVTVLAGAEILVRALPGDTRAMLTRGSRFRLESWRELPAAAAFCLVGASREELLYRDYLFVRLCDLGLPRAASVLACTLLFAVAHAYQGPLALGLALAQGMILAAAFIRTRSLGVPILAHTLYNFAALAAGLFASSPI